jgi:eukaryotic-like serine/threonine-protein kinase
VSSGGVNANDKSTAQDLAAANEIDLVCDAFAEAWSAESQPTIEEFLVRGGATLHEALFVELLLVECELRRRRGESIEREVYEQRFPQYAHIITSLSWETISRTPPDLRVVIESPALNAGTRISHFELIEEIGRGAFGTVWRARDQRLRRIVAIKFARQENLTEADRERFLREGRAAAKLRHPNIVTLYDVGEDNNRTFIVSELVEGASLRSWLQNHHATPREAAELVAQVAEALHHAHEQGVIHRDLKPANVLLDLDNRPHITDFGLAKLTADTAMTVEGHILGTPAYMAPEQALGEVNRIDRRTDVYGLGALLYELVSGKAPFKGDAASIVNQVIHSEPRVLRKLNPNASRDLETVCIKAMAKSSALRYPSAQEMAVDLRRYLRGEPIIARRANIVQKGWRWIRRRPALAASLLITGVAGAFAAATILSLAERNYRLQGYRPVRITSSPAGAQISMAPIDMRTGEPDLSEVIQPEGITPLTTLLRPGDYYVEAVLKGKSEPLGFVEAYRTVIPTGMQSQQQMKENRKTGVDEDLFRLSVTFPQSIDFLKDMAVVTVDEEMRRKNPSLPKQLYVDLDETAAKTRGFANAKKALVFNDKRLPSALEYVAIEKAVRDGQVRTHDGQASQLENIFGGLAEWTMTMYDFSIAGGDQVEIANLRSANVLKGYGNPSELPDLLQLPDGALVAPPDSNSARIGFRGVRSAIPRLLNDQ